MKLTKRQASQPLIFSQSELSKNTAVLSSRTKVTYLKNRCEAGALSEPRVHSIGILSTIANREQQKWSMKIAICSVSYSQLRLSLKLYFHRGIYTAPRVWAAVAGIVDVRAHEWRGATFESDTTRKLFTSKTVWAGFRLWTLLQNQARNVSTDCRSFATMPVNLVRSIAGMITINSKKELY